MSSGPPRPVVIAYLYLPLALLILMANNGVVLAQADAANATLKGKVLDQVGAAVSGATVTVTSAERGLVRSVKTDSAGSYRVPLLQPGNRVSAQNNS